jgi:hypothetical protein
MITRIESNDSVFAVFFESHEEAREVFYQTHALWICENVLVENMIAFPFTSNRIH